MKPEIGCSIGELHGMKGLPIYAQPNKMLSIQDVVGVLLSSKLEDSSICSLVPFSVEVNAVFVIDLNKLSSPNDVTCDDMGVWTWGGSKKRWVSVEDDEFVVFGGMTSPVRIHRIILCGSDITLLNPVLM